MNANRGFKRQDPAKLLWERLQNGEPVGFLYGGFELINEVLESTKKKFSNEDVFETDAAEQYPSDFATYDAINRFLFKENGRKSKLLIVKVRGWHGHRGYFNVLIWQLFKNPELRQRLKLIYVFPPFYVDAISIEQGPSPMVELVVNYEEATQDFISRYHSREFLGIFGIEFIEKLSFDKFSKKFKKDYIGSEQQKKDRKLEKPLPGTFLHPKTAWMKEKGYLNPNSYL